MLRLLHGARRLNSSVAGATSSVAGAATNSSVPDATSTPTTTNPLFPPINTITVTDLKLQADGENWYKVVRSRNNQLPVYREYQKGMRKNFTVIRNVEGSATQLRDDLRQALSLERKQVVVRSDGKKVVVKMDCGDIIKTLLGQHF